jgi:hypothetical protein
VASLALDLDRRITALERASGTRRVASPAKSRVDHQRPGAAGTGIAEVLGACFAGGAHILRANEISGDLHEIFDPHAGISEDRDYVPPASLGLHLDRFGHGSIRPHADFSRNVEKA